MSKSDSIIKLQRDDTYNKDVWIGSMVFIGIGAVGLLYALGFPRLGFNHIKNAEYVTPKQLGKRMYGYCVRVTDSDGIRVYHTTLPDLLSRNDVKMAHKLSQKKESMRDETISIRIAGADSPEGEAFGMTKQPLHDEAKEALKGMCLNKRVAFVPLRRDQYGRIVANVFVSPRFLIGKERNVSIELIKEGLANVYRQTGAVYGGMEKEFEAAELEAKKYKRGIWGLDNYVSPAAHKKKFKDKCENADYSPVEPGKKSIWQRIRGFFG